LVNP